MFFCLSSCKKSIEVPHKSWLVTSSLSLFSNVFIGIFFKTALLLLPFTTSGSTYSSLVFLGENVILFSSYSSFSGNFGKSSGLFFLLHLNILRIEFLILFDGLSLVVFLLDFFFDFLLLLDCIFALFLCYSSFVVSPSLLGSTLACFKLFWVAILVSISTEMMPAAPTD